MANRLSNSQISALLAKNVSALKPGELMDLRASLDVRRTGVGGDPDHARTDEAILNTMLPTTTTTTTTTTSSSTTTSTTTVSDRRLKRNVERLASVFGLSVCSYNFVGSDRRSVGLIAQEVWEKYPDAVVVGDGERPWKIRYDRLFAALGERGAAQLHASLATI